MDKVIFFRHQLFKSSEPFITQQGEALVNFYPVYVGRERFNDSLSKEKSLALSDFKNQTKFSSKLWQVLSRSPTPYLKLLAEENPKIIHAHFGVEGVYALPLAKKINIPLVTTFHGYDATTSTKALLCSGSPSWVNYAFFKQRLANQGNLFLCVSEYIRQRVIEMGFPEEKTFLHYIGIDSEKITERDATLETKTIVHVARLVEKKGTEYLVRAFGDCVSQFPDWQLKIIGEGPLQKKLEALVQELGLQKNVFFLGVQTHGNVINIIKKAAVLALPSVSAATGDAEGLGMALLEAAALGVPLIGTYHGGIPEVIIHNKTGLLSRERDVKALGDNLKSLMGNECFRRSLGKSARKLVEEKFNIHQQTKKLESFYQGVLDAR